MGSIGESPEVVYEGDDGAGSTFGFVIEEREMGVDTAELAMRFLGALQRRNEGTNGKENESHDFQERRCLRSARMSCERVFDKS